MTRRYLISAITVALASSALAQSRSGAANAPGDPQHQVTLAEYNRWKTELSNWGRWGKDDQLGALNLVTPAKRRQAAALVKDGVSVSLAREAAVDGSPGGDGAAGAPYRRVMTNLSEQGSADRLEIRYHGREVTHLDALAHRWFDGRMYNGFPASDVTREGGARKGAILELKNGIFTRGILMDIPRLKGVEALEPRARIYPEDFEAWEKTAGIKVSAGDAVLVRTGRWTYQAAHPDANAFDVAGLDPSVIPWLKKRDVALLLNESPGDAPARGDTPNLAVHDFALIVLGVHLCDNCDFDALARAAAARRRWDCLLSAAPLPVTGGNGSPINPIATF